MQELTERKGPSDTDFKEEEVDLVAFVKERLTKAKQGWMNRKEIKPLMSVWHNEFYKIRGSTLLQVVRALSIVWAAAAPCAIRAALVGWFDTRVLREQTFIACSTLLGFKRQWVTTVVRSCRTPKRAKKWQSVIYSSARSGHVHQGHKKGLTHHTICGRARF